ncbi:ATP-binding cassette domain-containing protein [Rhodobacteraceae bacterium F11138]|nr:ATP-binding cassette domain-containing protein [Rhodobacteraceae bacterium F11138]
MTLQLIRLEIRVTDAAPLFPPICLSVAPGQSATIMGRSGIGKSTLLDAIAGHLASAFCLTGQVRLNGRDILHLPPEARRIGLMFQDSMLFPHLSVGDNLAFGLARTVRGRGARRAAVEAALGQAGLEGMYDRDPASLSGGQKSRAALMRTLLAEPAALLLDEPFSKLDAALRQEMRSFTFRHIKARDIPALMVTHDPQDMEAAEGPGLVLEPATP